FVVVATGEGLERDECGIVAEQDADAGGGVDLRLPGAADAPLPAEPGTVEPVGDLDPAERATPVDDLGAGGRAAPGHGQAGTCRNGAAFAAAAAEVDRDQRQTSQPGLGLELRSEGADEAGDRPAVCGHQRVMPAGVGQVGSAGEAARDRTSE